jgi:cholecystokinin A receptor
MTAIAFDRYFCICMASKNVMNLSKAKTIVICLIVISCLLGVIPSLAAIINLENPSMDNNNNNQKNLTNFSSTCTLIDSNSNSTLFYFINLASLIHPFKYCYDLIFVVTVLIITVLYILIYSEIYTRRKLKRNRKHKLMLTKWMNGKTSKHKNKEIELKDIKNNENEEIDVKVDLIIENNNEDNNNNNNNNEIKQTEANDLKEDAEFKSKRKVNVISAKDIRTAFMLFVISFLFILFFLPSLIYTYRALLQMNLKTQTEVIYDEPNLILTYLYFSNSAINPILYCFLNPNFRADLIKFFFKRGSLFNNCMKRFSKE